MIEGKSKREVSGLIDWGPAFGSLVRNVYSKNNIYLLYRYIKNKSL